MKANEVLFRIKEKALFYVILTIKYRILNCPVFLFAINIAHFCQHVQQMEISTKFYG